MGTRTHAALPAGLLLLLVGAAALLAAQQAAGKEMVIDTPGGGKAKLKLKVKEVPQEAAPKSINPYEGKSYSGCEGGFCPPQDPELEREFWEAAEAGNAKVVKKLLGSANLNLTRNIVPDDAGLARVIDVAVWAASDKGKHDVMKVLLEHPGVVQLYAYEDGHILDLAAGNGDLEMVNLLLSKKMAVSPSSMAHAAHYNHTKVMMALLQHPMDLKSAMQAITNGGNAEMAKIMATIMKLAANDDPAKGKPNQHDWHGEYVHLAVTAGNVPVLKVLLNEMDYDVPWQSAQGLVMAAAERGNKEVMEVLLAQKVFKEDEDELDETVDNGLKVAAEMGSLPVLDLFIKKYPKQSKAHCKAAVFRAMKFGQDDALKRLLKICKVDTKSEKLQKAAWYGNLFKAARSGDAKLMAETLGHDKARSRILDLQTPVRNEKTGKVTHHDYPVPKQDPVVIAATRGHAEVVRLLAEYPQLCQACAAAEAAKANFTALAQEMIGGQAKHIKANSDQLIQNALRVVAFSMEAGNWDLVEFLIREHESVELGPYFLPAIAQEGKMQDLEKMMAILTKFDYDKNPYFKDQVHSARITAALGGNVDLLMRLQDFATPLTEEELAAAEEAAAGRAPAGGGPGVGNLDDFMRETGGGRDEL